ncbi:hypothetical protein [Rubripirellula lacrimiformis]|nr:hypothetical protein [Rubripirellula lacrimiformis]
MAWMVQAFSWICLLAIFFSGHNAGWRLTIHGLCDIPIAGTQSVLQRPLIALLIATLPTLVVSVAFLPLYRRRDPSSTTTGMNFVFLLLGSVLGILTASLFDPV